MAVLSSPRSCVPRLFAALLLCAPLVSVTATLVLYGHSNPIPSILTLPRDQVCPVSADGLTSTSFPWTHQPTCVEAIPDGDNAARKETFCVYTSSHFANNRGISLITTPDVATAYLLESFSHEDQEVRGQEPYLARETPGKGMGLFAKAKVEAGDSLIVKHPVLVISRHLLHKGARAERHRLLETAVGQLPEHTRKTFLGLAKSRGGHELDDVVQTNAMGIGGLGGIAHLAVVPEAARINHACRPNTFYRFDDYTLTLDLFALRDIEPGEELTYSYGFSDHPHESRTSLLKENWAFTCTCDLCTSSPEALALSDERLDDISTMRQTLPTGFENVPQFVALLPNLIDLMEKEGLVVEKPMYEEILAYSWSVLGRDDRAKYWAAKARKGWEIIAGKGSNEAQRTGELERDVKAHGTWMTWDKDPWDDSVWEDDDHHHHDGEGDGHHHGH